MAADALLARGLTVEAGTRAIVDDVSLTLAPGEIAGLTGPSGAGKSTLAYALLGLAQPPLRIGAGSVEVAGTDLLALPARQAAAMRGRRIALIVQNPRAALHPMLPVGHQVARIWRAHHRGRPADAQARAIEMLRLVGINDAERRAAAFPHELSGGMAQRVLIAAALAAEPDVLIADEPTSGLDVTVQATFLDMMWRAARDRDTAMLLITQEPGILANYCDRVLVMESGRIVADRTTAAHFVGHTSAVSTTPAPLPADGSAAVEARGLAKTFPVRGSRSVVHAVADVDIMVAGGETLGLVGESGSGKTTAGRTLIQLIEPDAGTVRVGGVDIARLPRRVLRNLRAKMQLVRQDPYDSFDPRWTMARSIAEPLLAAGRDAVDDRVAEMLALVGCAAADGAARPRDLAAGTLQRIAVARALATAPDFVVLDEPTSVLTPEARTGLIALLRQVQARTGTAFLLISHDLTTVAAVSHRVSVMYLGQIVETGTTRQIFARPRHPYTRALIAAHLGEDPTKRRVDRIQAERLDGEIPSPIDLPPGCYLASRCSYAVARCVAERQPLRRVGEATVRCWRAEDLPPFAGRPE